MKQIICIFEKKRKMAGVPGLFRQFKPRGFSYTPVYYDPKKEEREARERRIKAELGIVDDKEEKSNYKPGITRGSMSGYFNKTKTRVQKYTLIRVIVIALILFMVAYVLFYL